MGLDVPDLDDRTYEELLEDARKLIPVHSEEWTDHNAHDPGITILETLAWIAETYVYQLDQVTDAHRRKYLKLLGSLPRYPTPASVELQLTPTAGFAGQRVPAGVAVVAAGGAGGADGSPTSSGPSTAGGPATGTVFETTAPFTPTLTGLERVVSEDRAGRTDNTTANGADGMHYLAFGEAAEAGSSIYLGFDRDPFAAPRLDLAVDFHEEGLPAPASHGDEPPEFGPLVETSRIPCEATFEPSVAIVWEHCTDYATWHDDAVWADVAVAHDGTNQLYGSGTVSLVRPPTWQPADARGTILDQDTAYYWLRCRVVEAGYEIPPQLDAIRLNVVPARQRTVVRGETLRRDVDEGHTTDRESTTARPGQRFVFANAPVLDATVGVGDSRWTRVDDFDASSPDDTHYVLESTAGAVRFGDGVRGAIPQVGQSVVAERYVHGGGEAGNVAAGTDWWFRSDGVCTYYCTPHRARGMRGAIVVGDPAEAADGTPVEPEYGGWFGPDPADPRDESEVDSYDGTVDRRGEAEVTVEVGADGNDGAFAFSPTAVRIDPGTTVRFVWVTGGHDVAVEAQPAGSDWTGHPDVAEAGTEASHTFAVGRLRALPVTARGGATGGRDAESVDEALGRLKRDLDTPYRTVTHDDYRDVAMSTPGLRFGRATALVDAGPEREGCETAQTVTVVVVPYSTLNPPVPSRGFLEAVRRHLRKHRLLTDRVGVRPPTFVAIGVVADVRLVPGYSEAGRTEAVTAALDAFLDPLEGFDGEGWPFGRTLYASEVYAVIEGVEGVDCVRDVTLRARGAERVDGDGNVVIAPTALLSPADHDVSVSADRDDCEVR
jgi:plastocyanin